MRNVLLLAIIILVLGFTINVDKTNINIKTNPFGGPNYSISNGNPFGGPDYTNANKNPFGGPNYHKNKSNPIRVIIYNAYIRL